MLSPESWPVISSLQPSGLRCEAAECPSCALRLEYPAWLGEADGHPAVCLCMRTSDMRTAEAFRP